ncbi:hypothetical protein V5O48_015644 [Marasmius crinis-equi]|uniref:Uncharacterized protein n=1 Tax=Marasmius crinis-equi TaxID=585013 RepID=A0ABR3EU04_9AGAR
MSIVLDKTLDVLRVAITLALKLEASSRLPESSSAMTQIRAHWGSSLDPWLQFVIRDLVLCEDGPSTPKGVDILELTHSVVPAFLLGIFSETPHILKTLQPLITQAWFRVIDNHHRSWGLWSRLSGGLGEMQQRVILLSEPYSEDKFLGLVFVTFLSKSAHQVKTMDIEQLYDLRSFMICHNPHLTSFSGSTSPMYHPEAQGAVAQALCLVLSTLVKRRSVSHGLEKSEAIYDLLSATLGYVAYHLVREPRMVAAILQAGIVKSLLKLQHPSAAEPRLEEIEQENFVHPGADGVELSSTRKIRAMLGDIKGENAGATGVTTTSKGKGLTIMLLSRRDVRALSRNMERQNLDEHGIFSVRAVLPLYIVLQIVEQWTAGKDFVNTKHEVKFFLDWLHSQLSRIVNSVMAQFRSYIAALPENVSGNKRLIREGLKNPVLFIDIRSHPGMITSQLVQVFEPNDLNVELETMFGPYWRVQGDTFLNEWKDPRRGAETVWIIAFLPKTGWYPAITKASFPFPFAYDL